LFEPALEVVLLAGLLFAEFTFEVFVSTEFELAELASVLTVFTVFESGVVCKTDTPPPLIAGIASNKAESIKVAAAVMVILDKTDWVPRGPKAVLETLLVKSAPASALPGCNRTAPTKTKHEIKNNP
jgi:hypothetical protein